MNTIMNTLLSHETLIPSRISLRFPFNSTKTMTRFRTTTTKTTFVIRSNDNNTERSSNQQQQQQLNLSVLRFTLGIPGFDESYLPRWIGYEFGWLLVLNHFIGSSLITPAQIRVEALGLSLASFSVAVPYLGKFLKGAAPLEQATLPEGSEQIYGMSQNLSDLDKEDLAWATYILLRNTNTISVLVSLQDEICVRGYWNMPDDVLKANMLDWFKGEIKQYGLSDFTDSLYFPRGDDSGVWKILPKGTQSFLVQPMKQVPNENANEMDKNHGFVLLASTMNYAYSEKDRAWIGAVANKFRGKSSCTTL